MPDKKQNDTPRTRAQDLLHELSCSPNKLAYYFLSKRQQQNLVISSTGLQNTKEKTKGEKAAYKGHAPGA